MVVDITKIKYIVDMINLIIKFLELIFVFFLIVDLDFKFVYVSIFVFFNC